VPFFTEDMRITGTGLLKAKWPSCHPVIGAIALKENQVTDPNPEKPPTSFILSCSITGLLMEGGVSPL